MSEDERPKLKDARSICEYMETRGGGKVDRTLIHTALKEGWKPVSKRIMWPDGTYVNPSDDSSNSAVTGADVKKEMR